MGGNGNIGLDSGTSPRFYIIGTLLWLLKQRASLHIGYIYKCMYQCIKNNCFWYPDILGDKCICIVNIVIFKTIGCHVNTREETAPNKSLCKQENEKPLYSAGRNSTQTLHCILKQLMTT